MAIHYRLPVLLHSTIDHGVLPVVLALAGLGSVFLLTLAIVALVRRGSRSYILITAALATLLARTGAGVLLTIGVLSLDDHHLLEHMLDVVLTGLLLAAIYYARTTMPSDEVDVCE